MNRQQLTQFGRTLPIVLALVGTGPAYSAEPSDPARVLVPNITGVVILPSAQGLRYEGIKPSELPDPVEVKGPEFLNTKTVEEVASRYIGQPLTVGSLDALQKELILISRKEGHYVVDVFYVEDVDVTDGVVQVVVQEGTLQNLTVRNAGRKYYSDESIIERSGFKPGEPVLEHNVRRGLTRLNQNRIFREVTPRLRQGTDVGTVDVELEVKDRFPLRPFLGYDNYGTKLLGEDRLSAGFTWFNGLGGLDHELTYQFTTDIGFQHFQSHALSYRMPLAWLNHSIVASGVYSEVEGDFAEIGFPDIRQLEGNNQFVSARYIAPLPTLRWYDHHVRFGFDYRRVENALEFVPGGDFDPQPIEDRADPFEVAQFALAYHLEVPDRLGYTAADAEGIYSPGDLMGANSDEAFEEQRRGAEAHYMYVRLRGERALKLPLTRRWMEKAPDQTFTAFVAGTWQTAPDPLMVTEQLIIGGIGTVRGYPERFQSGDEGYIVNAELRTPSVMSWVPWVRDFRDSHLYFFGFFDYASVSDQDDRGGGESDMTLYSAGAGLSMAVGSHFQLRVDGGLPLTEKDRIEAAGEDSGWRTHIAVQVAF